MTFRPFLLCLFFGMAGCSSTPADHYRKQLEPLIQSGKHLKAEVDALYGAPRFCAKTADGETCEYFVSPKPGAAATDVLHVYFDHQDAVTGWEPLYLPH